MGTRDATAARNATVARVVLRLEKAEAELKRIATLLSDLTAYHEAEAAFKREEAASVLQ